MWVLKTETGSRNWSIVLEKCCLLACKFRPANLACSAFFFIQRRTNCPGVTPLTADWVIINQSLAYRPDWWKKFLNWDSLFPNGCSLVKFISFCGYLWKSRLSMWPSPFQEKVSIWSTLERSVYITLRVKLPHQLPSMTEYWQGQPCRHLLLRH